MYDAPGNEDRFRETHTPLREMLHRAAPRPEAASGLGADPAWITTARPSPQRTPRAMRDFSRVTSVSDRNYRPCVTNSEPP